MILIDKADVVRIGLEDHTAFQIEWVIGSHAAVQADYADVLAEGPFLLTVNDECAWAGQHEEALYRVAERRLDPTNYQQWQDLVDIYVDSIGVSRQGFLLRFAAMRRRLRHEEGWIQWRRIYHWQEGSDLVWTSLLHHPEIEAQVHVGEREVRYVG